jgi:hypothetical protein
LTPVGHRHRNGFDIQNRDRTHIQIVHIEDSNGNEEVASWVRLRFRGAQENRYKT